MSLSMSAVEKEEMKCQKYWEISQRYVLVIALELTYRKKEEMHRFTNVLDELWFNYAHVFSN